MLKRLLRLAIFSLLFLSSYSAAIGLSGLTVNSAVGERFYGLIAITGAEGVPVNDMLVSLAPRSVYRAMGVEWEYFHSQLIFDVLVDDNNQYTIRIISSDVVYEPYLDFVVSLRSPVGSISKQLTALLEMPATTIQPSLHTSVTKSIKAPVSAQALPSKEVKKIQRSPISKKPQTSNRDKNLVTDSDKSITAITSAIESTDAEMTDVEALEAKVAEPKVDKAKVDETKVDETKVDETKVAETVANKSETDSWSHKTRSGDSLWAVARRVQAETGGNIKPIVDALYKNNSHAFIKNDIDRLKINARLAVSAAQISAVIVANKQAGQSSQSDSATLLPAPQLVDELVANEDGVLSLVTADDNTAAIAAETVELSERSDALANDFDQGLSASKERELSVEARMDILYLQYEALAEKTEQLKLLEQSLNRSIADKSQLNMALDESLSKAANNDDNIDARKEAEEDVGKDVGKEGKVTDKRQLFFVISIAIILLLLLVLFLKRWQAQRRSSDIDNWSLDTERSLSPQPIDSLAANHVSLSASESALDTDTGVDIEVDIEIDTDTEIDTDIDTDIDTNIKRQANKVSALPAEGAVELEAAVYIAYERYDEAEDLLEQALEIDPDNEALQMQLLEVYAVKGKSRHFDLLANQISDHDNDKMTIKIKYLKSKL
ncbi:hypothetical protein N9F42_00500 [Pseudomonadales bacterium]|nr:hypothetical protein [Pseudomonadales bacterium]